MNLKSRSQLDSKTNTHTPKMTEATNKMTEAYKMAEAGWSNAGTGSNTGSKAEQTKALYAALHAEHTKNIPADGFDIPGNHHPQPIPERIRNPAEHIRQWQQFFADRPELKVLAHRQERGTHLILEREFRKWSQAQ